MTKQVLFIHSAGPQKPSEGSNGLTAYLKEALGAEYQLLTPEMPNPEDPRYSLWKEQLEKEFTGLDREVILVGHSLGGSVLVKYLAEKTVIPVIAGLFLVATPYWGGKKGWQAEEFNFPVDFASRLPSISRICLYHSQNDEVVPFSHLEHFNKQLPNAETRILEGHDHTFQHGLPALVDDIQQI
ncbi:hypothetical protein ATL39_1861 [Sinobaca qinghaiensis]|uniref:Serine hydrolase family protein n=1 Tax=Sinobaca qinghaiensis TaxID=342944 RepID=A0A419V4Z3_9BACL|nr:alpha/beta fold hydrolase [Sinobaca qinghaiensis]RKD73565.1 hypothetical protein ATL39_1861 [Sinobaca qinghaiensis]